MTVKRRLPLEPVHFPEFYSSLQALRRHASGGNVLIAATVLALAAANIPVIRDYYTDFWTQEIRLQIGSFNIFSHSGHPMSLLAFINDALMAIFFFSIGLEIKREILKGELSSIRHAMLPIIAAIGGMAIPVGIYCLLGHGTDYSGGAAIPMATDIAFTLGVLSMFGNRVPVALKIFLTTLAVVDDIGGIVVIATVYSHGLELTYMALAACLLILLLAGAAMRIKSKVFYLGIGGVIWFLTLNSGIHPTIAGVLVALCVPVTPVFAPKKYIKIIRGSIAHFRSEDDETLSARTILSHEQLDWLKVIESASDKVISPLQDLEDSLHPIVNYFIVPLFAFANAGIFLLDLDPASIVEGVSIAIIAGLLIGKTIGILLFSFLAIKLRIAAMPEGTDWRMLSAVAVLGGIGFTVSLFIANLTFDTPAESAMLNQAKLGIVAGSLIAGIAGYILLGHSLRARSKKMCSDSHEGLH